MRAFGRRDLGWLAIFFVAIGASLAIGATRDLDWAWILELRVPRTVLALAVGAALSVAGAVLQAFFKNPLCEPYTLGVSSGATLGAVIGSTLGLNALFFGLSPSALFGAVGFSGILLAVSRSRRVSASTLLLVGVMLGFLGSSFVAVWMAIGDPMGVQSAIGWLLGDLSRAEGANAWITLAIVVAVTGALYADHRSLDALLVGEEEANAVGVDLAGLRTRAILWTSILVAVAVSLSGMIGFVGLVVPQLVRGSGSTLHRRVLPVCALAGGTVLVIADTIARSVIAPYELPVGVVTAIVGAPFFIAILLRKRGAA
ncbi:MAG: iron chelate uptake ABC transporter family permease subunit [Bdellovibrionales bacterium]|nr:iron chelate uptake ABC transporter family permease subunit [Bdellovibrionales bacterium]